MSACIKFLMYDGYGSIPVKQYIDVPDTSDNFSLYLKLIYPSDRQILLFILRAGNGSPKSFYYTYIWTPIADTQDIYSEPWNFVLIHTVVNVRITILTIVYTVLI